MSTDFRKKIMIVSLSLCLGLLLCTFGFTRLRSFFNMMEVAGTGQAPIRSLRLTIDKTQREDLFEQLRAFAAKHGFEYDLTDFNTDGENFQFWMSREDTRIIAGDVPPDPTLVFIRFYARYPGAPVDEETVEVLMEDLKNFIDEIQNVTITEEK